MFAAMFGRLEMLEVLKARGAALDRRNRIGLSAGFLAEAAGLFSTLSILKKLASPQS